VDTAGNLFTIAGSGRTGDGQSATDTRYGEFEPGFTPSLRDNCSGLGIAPPLPCPTATRDTPSARFDRPQGLAVAPDGSIFIADKNDNVVRRLVTKDQAKEVFNLPGPDRTDEDLTDFKDAVGRSIYRIITVAGERRPAGARGPADFGGFLYGDTGSADGLPALSTQMRHPSALAFGPDGNLYVLDQGNLRVLQITQPLTLKGAAYRVAGAYQGDSGSPSAIQVLNPRYVLAAPDGSLYVADSDRSVVRKISADGTFATVVAGTGTRGGTFEPDGIPATQARLAWPTGLALGPDGSLYIADRGAHKIRKVGPDGIITTVAGTGRGDYQLPTGFSPEGRPATQEPLYSPSAVVVAPDGTLFIADTFNSRIRRVGPDGSITTIAGTGAYGYNGDGIPATSADLFHPADLALGPDRALYFTDSQNAAIRRIDRSGMITTVAGTAASAGFAGDGGAATAAQLNGPDGLTIASDGTLYIADTGNNRIRKVAPDGTITTVVGTGTAGEAGDGGPADRAQLRAPRSVSIDGAGNLYIADTDNNRVRMVGAAR
jgi:streptogramin lyase